MKQNRIIFLSIVLVVGLICGLLIATKLDIIPFSSALSSKSSSQIESEVATLSSIPQATETESAFIKVAKEVGPSVVSISTEHTEKIGGRRFYFRPFEGTPFEDEFFRQFFKEFFEIPKREFKRMGLGSGVIIDAKGYILTNEHVIKDADKITVTLPDEREFKGEVRGTDPRSDLAVVKISAHHLPVVKLGDSDEVKIGQWAIAIGNPFGFAVQSPEPTVTVGVVSALHRSLPRTSQRDRAYTDLIQTDAAINPGNSGGPLVNLKGEVIGINVAIFTTSGGYQGVGFAIPINVARNVVGRLIEGKRVLYGWLGINVQDLDENLATYFGLPDREGVLVAKVLEGSPAQKGGFKDGDLIRTFNGKKIKDVNQLLKEVGRTQVGKKVKVDIIRDKSQMTLEVEIGERPSEIEEFGKLSVKTWRGIEVQEITPDIAKRFGLEEKTGLVISNVEVGSPAD